jgi:hypothetical protein
MLLIGRMSSNLSDSVNRDDICHDALPSIQTKSGESPVPIGDAPKEEVDVNKARFDGWSDVEPIAISASRALRQQQIVDLQARSDRRVFGRHTLGYPRGAPADPASRPELCGEWPYAVCPCA